MESTPEKLQVIYCVFSHSSVLYIFWLVTPDWTSFILCPWSSLCANDPDPGWLNERTASAQLLKHCIICNNTSWLQPLLRALPCLSPQVWQTAPSLHPFSQASCYTNAGLCLPSPFMGPNWSAGSTAQICLRSYVTIKQTKTHTFHSDSVGGSFG